MQFKLHSGQLEMIRTTPFNFSFNYRRSCIYLKPEMNLTEKQLEKDEQISCKVVAK